MADHFSIIGFPADDQAGMQELASLSARAGKPLQVANGYYIRFAPGHGAELWVQANPQRQLIGCHPHFEGSGRLRAQVSRVLSNARSPLDGTVMATAIDADGAGYPFAVDVPDFEAAAGELKPSARVSFQIAAFASELRCFADEASLRADSAISRLAPEAFIPSGLFRPDGKPIEPPQARAVLTGRILAAERRTNPLTGIAFQYAHVRTLGGTIDVVADPATIQGELRAGGILFGGFWLSGRIAPAAPDLAPRA